MRSTYPADLWKGAKIDLKHQRQRGGSLIFSEHGIHEASTSFSDHLGGIESVAIFFVFLSSRKISCLSIPQHGGDDGMKEEADSTATAREVCVPCSTMNFSVIEPKKWKERR